jgi:sarcosine oxidase, subunit beta
VPNPNARYLTPPTVILAHMGLSIFQLARHALSGHRRWPAFWRSARPREHYDVVIIGGGGHGLATAYYLKRNHGVASVAVVEKGWIGGGNTGRNTTIVRSNYLAAPSIRFYDFALRLYEKLSLEIGYNIMLSQRGVVTLAFSRQQLRLMNRRVNALRHAGVASELLTMREIMRLLPLLRERSAAGRRVFGGFIQRRGGVVRHDAVAWGYARAANALGVDIIQDCEVTGFRTVNGAVTGVETRHGIIATPRVGIAVAGNSSLLAAKLGVGLPITSMALQAMVSEPVKPVLDVVLDGAFYVSQSDRGELVMGGGTDVYTSYAQRSGIQRVEDNMAVLIDLFPAFGRLRFMRQWAGLVDLTPDASPIIDSSPVGGAAFSCGWGTYGFKAIPAGGVAFAHLIATGTSHPLALPFSLDRFATGALIDEGGSSGMDDRELLL